MRREDGAPPRCKRRGSRACYNLWLLGNEANRSHLERSIRQLEAHAGQPHELAEDTDA